MAKTTMTILIILVILITGFLYFYSFSGNKFDSPKYFYDQPEMIDLLRVVEKGDAERIKALQEEGVDLNLEGREGMRPIFWAMGRQSKDGLRILLELGADPDVNTPGLGSPLHLAAVAEDSEYLEILLTHKADPNIKNDAGDPVTVPMIRQRRWEHLKFWLDKGGDIDITNAVNETPVYHAAMLNQYEQVAYMIERGADFRIPAQSGDTVAHLVHTSRVNPGLPAYKWQQKVREMLLDRGVEFPPPTPAEVREMMDLD